MAWFSGKVSLGNFPDLAGAVNKLSESVKNIEKNFDTALGLEENSDNAASSSDGSLWAFMGQSGESTEGLSEEPEQAKSSSSDVDKDYLNSNKSPKSKVGLQQEEKQDAVVQTPVEETETVNGEKRTTPVEETETVNGEKIDSSAPAIDRSLADLSTLPVEVSTANDEQIKGDDSSDPLEKKSFVEPLQENVDDSSGNLVTEEPPSSTSPLDQVLSDASLLPPPAGSGGVQDSFNDLDKGVLNDVPGVQAHESSSENMDLKEQHSVLDAITTSEVLYAEECPRRISSDIPRIQEVAESVSHSGSPEAVITSVAGTPEKTSDTDTNEQELKLIFNTSSLANAEVTDLDMMKKEMRMMESALQGAARQAQAKADELVNTVNENEQLKAVMEDLQRKSIEAVESLREEHHQKVAALERKVYVLTRERDTLRREQSKKSDAAALLKEKDEIITQVMAEGEQLSKKQAAQESHIRKLRAQIRELEEEKKGLLTKLEVEDNKFESIKKDKAATEKLLQETFEKHQAELVTQKEYYTNALNAAKEAEALAEARANTEARTELESRLREVEERETMLVQALEELRQTLSRKEQQAVFREEMLQRDIEDLQKRYQASERRCEELITQVPDSTRPLLRQIEAMQETTSRKAEAWAAVERSLNSRLQKAEARADAAEERGQSINERLSQTLSRINVLEAQISCLRAEQTQLTRSLEKERQRAAENRQEYLALKEDADTNEGRVKQFEEEIRELRRKHKQEIQEATINLELLQQELEKEKAARIQSSVLSDQSSIEKRKSWDKGYLNRRLSSASSLSSMEESYFLQASLGSSNHLSEHRNGVEGTLSPYYIKSMPPSAFEAALRQKDGELASYMSRLASLESIRDSLAEELVKMTAQCEKLHSEVAMVPGLRAELEALRRRHSAALELMGERDEELEELRADIVDLKEMYREQVNMLVNKIQRMNSSMVVT